MAMENPFCTRRTKPGAISYLFSSNEDMVSIINRLRENKWRGAIVGPHGCGKTTLLGEIAAYLPSIGHVSAMFVLHDGQRRMPDGWRDKIDAVSTEQALIAIVDGYEQLSRLSRFLLKRYCSRSHIGLLVTAHRQTDIKTIHHVMPTVETANRIVALLLRDTRIAFPSELVNSIYKKHGGNIREVLFELYDFAERKKQEA
jgi:hypothetical protein